MTVAVTLPDHLDTRPVKRNDSVLVRTAGDSTKHAPLPSLHGAFPWRNATLEFGSALDSSHNRCTRPLRRLFINRPQLYFLLSSLCNGEKLGPQLLRTASGPVRLFPHGTAAE